MTFPIPFLFKDGKIWINPPTFECRRWYEGTYRPTNGWSQSGWTTLNDVNITKTASLEAFTTAWEKSVNVGQTDKSNVTDRFKKHVAEGKKKSKPKKGRKKKYKIREVVSENWDPYQASV